MITEVIELAKKVRSDRVFISAFAVLTLVMAGVALAGCGKAVTSDTAPVKGQSMAGAVVDVNVSPSALSSRPKPWVLDDPESAVRSYIDWVSYAWRTGQSQVATPTMTPYEEVRVDSYVQYNIQKGRLIDQSLIGMEFGRESIIGSSAVLPAKEKWKYRYVSISEAGKTIGGPYEASYETTYTLVRGDTGGWVVDSVQATALGDVK